MTCKIYIEESEKAYKLNDANVFEKEKCTRKLKNTFIGRVNLRLEGIPEDRDEEI